MTLVEVMIASGVVAVLLMATAAAFSSNIKAVGMARSLTGGGIFLETVHEDLMAQSFNNLLALNGNQVFDGDSPAASQFRVDLDVFLVSPGLIQVRAGMVDLQSGNELARIVFMRAES